MFSPFKFNGVMYVGFTIVLIFAYGALLFSPILLLLIAFNNEAAVILDQLKCDADQFHQAKNKEEKRIAYEKALKKLKGREDHGQ